MIGPIDGDEAVRVLEVLRAREWAAYSWLPEAHRKAAFEEAIAAIRALPAASPCRACVYVHKTLAQLREEEAEEGMR